MIKKVVLVNKEVLDSVIQLLIILLIGLPMYFLVDRITENEIMDKVFHYSFVIILLSAISISKKVCIENKKIVEAIAIFGFVFKSSSFLISEIDKIYLNQNDEDYFEIKIKRIDNSEIVIKKLPNKNPALAELDLIKEHIKLAQNQ